MTEAPSVPTRRLTPPRAGAGAHAAVILATLFVLTAVALTGCGQLEPVAPGQPVTDPAQLYVRLTLNYPAVNLTSDTTAVAANTLQLVATPYDGTGTPIGDAPAPVFTTSDTTAVTVTPDGLVQAHRAVTEVKVVATLTIGGVRQIDTAIVNVQDIPAADVPALDTFSIHVPPENAVWYPPSSGQTFLAAFFAGLVPPLPWRVTARAVDATGTPLPGPLAVDYASLDSSVMTVDRRTGNVSPIRAGHASVVARTIAFGVPKVDTMTHTVQPSFAGTISIDRLGFFVSPTGERPATATSTDGITTIVAGGLVGWLSHTQALMDVVFDDATNVAAPPSAFFFCNPNCAAGDIAAFSGDSVSQSFTIMRFRQFPIPGIYPFHNTATGAQGKVIVLEPIPLP